MNRGMEVFLGANARPDSRGEDDLEEGIQTIPMPSLHELERDHCTYRNHSY